MPSTIQAIGTLLFAVAIAHTFATSFFQHLAHRRPAHAGLWHLLGEVEVVFGFWAAVLMAAMFTTEGATAALRYIDAYPFIEPMFVFAIMVIAGSRPILQTARRSTQVLSRLLPLPSSMAFYVTVMAIVPLMGSLLTEAAAMTLAALILRDRFFRHGLSSNLQYATLG
ncbi:MAG: putative Na+/H+ antiporter, partial [Nitrospira sp.]|nr:putative Na+/H+ antiporter [Nitrospira sp.]